MLLRTRRVQFSKLHGKSFAQGLVKRNKSSKKIEKKCCKCSPRHIECSFDNNSQKLIFAHFFSTLLPNLSYFPIQESSPFSSSASHLFHFGDYSKRTRFRQQRSRFQTHRYQISSNVSGVFINFYEARLNFDRRVLILAFRKFSSEFFV